MNNELSTLPQNILDAADLKDWLKTNDPAEHLGEAEAGFYVAARSHDARGDTQAMQENARILHSYEVKAFANSNR